MRHITVIAEDRTGLIAELTDLLARHQINIAALNAQLYGHDAVIHLEVDQYEKTIHALEEEQFRVVADEAVLLRIADQPGALAMASKRLAENNIDIRSMTVVQRHDGYTIVAVGCSDNAAARMVLADALVN